MSAGLGLNRPRAPMTKVLGVSGKLFAHDMNRLFVSPRSREGGVPELTIAGPLGVFDFSDQHRLDPVRDKNNKVEYLG